MPIRSRPQSAERAPTQENADKRIYQPFPIYDYESGLVLSRAPWIIPTKAFSDILNFYIERGRLIKRRGYQHFAKMVYQVRDETADTGDGDTKSFTLTPSNTPLRPSENSAYFKIKAGDQEVVEDEYDEDENTSTLKGDGSGTVDWDENEISVEFDSAPGDGTDITIDYEYVPGRPITGIWSYWSGAGDEQLLFFDRRRVNRYYPLEGKARDDYEEDLFDEAEDDDWVFMDVWKGDGFVTNGIDTVKKYDGSDWSKHDGDDSLTLNTAHLLYSYKERMVFLRPTEDGTIQPQRARWTAPGTSDNFEDGGYIDAPALDWIMGADFLGDRLIVFFERSIWALDYVGDYDVPFAWEKLVETEGCSAPMSVLPFANEIFTLGPVEFVVTDSNTVEQLDRDVPEISLNFNQELYDKVYGAILEELDQVYWSYARPEDDHLTQQVVHNYRNGSWTIYDTPIQAVGYFREQADYKWEQLNITWQESDFAWADKEAQSGYPLTLGGTRDGEVKVLNRGCTEDGSAVEARAKTKAFNPFVESQRKARLGFIDIYYEIDPAVEVVIRVYEYDNDVPYFEKTITLDGKEGISKDFKRLTINRVSKFHMVEIEHTQDVGRPHIHAMFLWIKPAGNLGV